MTAQEVQSEYRRSACVTVEEKPIRSQSFDIGCLMGKGRGEGDTS